jgi:hypothetical protein
MKPASPRTSTSRSSRTVAFALGILTIHLFLPLSPFAAQSQCSSEAAAWIGTLNTTLSSEKEMVLTSHSQAKCDFAAKWLKEIKDVRQRDKRERTCTDLVLIWTHKECIYFRDYVTTSSYAPCKNWTRDMFRHCMAGEIEWFLLD